MNDAEAAAPARLGALASHLKAHGFAVEMVTDGLVVRNIHDVSRQSGDGRATLADTITCRPRSEDGGTLWFFTSWRQPITEADRITDAVVQIKAYLTSRKDN